MGKQSICFFNSCKTWGGGEKWHFEIAKWAVSKGYDVTVFAHKKGELYKRVTEETNIKCFGISLNNRSFLNPFKYLEIKNKLLSHHIDTIILCLPIDVKVAGVAAKMAGIKRIVYRRGCAIPIKNSFYNRFLFRKILTNVIANSNATKESILERNPDLFPKSKIKVLYNGIDISKRNDSSIMNLRKGDEILLGNAGRIVEHKKLELLIEIAKILKDRGHNFRILIAGEGNLREALEAKAEKEDVSDKITFVGFINDITAFMNTIDIFLFPSKGEGFGYVMAEAMLAQKPVVAFDICSSPELIDSGKNGYLVPPYDIDDFADKAERLISDINLRNNYGECGHDMVLNRFSEETIFRMVEDYIEDINPQKAIKISASIITLNEEKNIARCLKSLEGIVDEVVIVDSFSTDKTENICKKYNARFIKNKFGGHIEQKNFAVSQCSNDYVLAIDADEALSDELRESILEVKKNWKHDGYYFNRRNHYCGRWIRHGSWHPDHSLRLWDKTKGRWGGLNPHDKFMLFPGASKAYIKGDLLHFSYYSIEEHVLQANKFSTISAHSRLKNGIRSNLFKIWFYPKFRFFRDYIIKFGILDGFYGYIISKNNAHEVFLKYTKLLYLTREEKRKSKC